MKNILIFKTSADETVHRLLAELENENVFCLIQSDGYERFCQRYSKVHFIDIQKEGFYDLPKEVKDQMIGKRYDELYITFSGLTAHNYGNVLEVAAQCSFEVAYFYNCKGERIRIPAHHPLKEWLIRSYIRFVEFFYRKGKG